MKSIHVPLTVSTSQKAQIIELTDQIAQAVDQSGVRDGFVHIQSMHTTAGLLVNEYQSALLDDMAAFIDRFVDGSAEYRHNDPRYSDCDRSNAASHLRSLLLNPTLVLPLADGRVVTGRYQRVLFVELDGPRERTVSVRCVGVPVGTIATNGTPVPRQRTHEAVGAA